MCTFLYIRCGLVLELKEAFQGCCNIQHRGVLSSRQCLLPLTHSFKSVMGSFNVLKVAVAISSLSHLAAAITQCPTTPTTYTGPGGAKYAICAATDYVGPSDEMLANTATVTACAQACDARGNCLKAVYDNTNKVCHIKNNGANALNWVQNNQFTVVYLNNSKLHQFPSATRSPVLCVSWGVLHCSTSQYPRPD